MGSGWSHSGPTNEGQRGSAAANRGHFLYGVVPAKRPAQSRNQGRPRQDSNLRTRLRRPMLYPLSYEGGK